MRRLSAIPVLILALVACGTPAPAPEEAKPAETPATTETPAGTAAPAEATTAAPATTEGTAAAPSGVTKDSLNASAAADFPAFARWDETMAKVEPKLGKPMKTAGDTSMWYAKDGDKCTILTATKMGDIVGGAVVTEGPCPAP